MATTNDIVNSNLEYSQSIKSHFEQNGYSQPRVLEDTGLTEEIKSSISRGKFFGIFAPKRLKRVLKKPYGARDVHLYSSLIQRCSLDPAIIRDLGSIMEEPIYVWMGQIVQRDPFDQGQDWHIDQTNWELDGVHATVALTDMKTSNGCLSVIPGTHRYGITNKELLESAKTHGFSLNDANALASYADVIHPENAPHKVVSVEASAGTFFFTKGGLWHGVSPNTSNNIRPALIIRYCGAYGKNKRKQQSTPCFSVSTKTEGLETGRKASSFLAGNIIANYSINRLMQIF